MLSPHPKLFLLHRISLLFFMPAPIQLSSYSGLVSSGLSAKNHLFCQSKFLQPAY